MMKLSARFSLAALTASLLWLSALPARAQLYVGLQSNGTIGKYDATTGAAINADFVTGLMTPEGLLLSGNVLYEVDYTSGVIGSYDATTGAAINPALVTGVTGADGLAISGNDLFVSNISGSVGEYDLATGAAINANLVTGYGNGQSMVLSGTHLFVTGYQGNSVIEIDTVTGTVLNASFITGLNNPVGVTASGNILFVANFGSGTDGTVGKYDATTGAAINASFIPSGLNAPNSLAIAGNTLYVSNFGGGYVGAYDATTGAAINDNLISGLSQPVSLAIAGSGNATPTPTPGPTPTPTPGPTPTPTPPPTPAPLPTPTPAAGALSCAIISPPEGAPIAAGAQLSVAVRTFDDVSRTVLMVRYYLDGALVGTTGATGPFYITITAPAAGSHVLQASAQDSGGQTATGSETLTTYAANNPPPTITDIDGLDDYTVVDGEIVIGSAEAKPGGPGAPGAPDALGAPDVPGAPGGAITDVTFYMDSTPMDGGPGDIVNGERHGPVRLDASVVSPLTGGGSLYRLAIAVSSVFAGHDMHIFSVATDTNGEQQISAISTLHVKDAMVVGTPPVVTLGVTEGTRMPVGQATAIPVTVTAGANPLTLTQYMVNGKVITDSNASPNGFSFTPPAAGQYLLNAAATDTSGLSGFGTPVLVTAFDLPVVTLKVKGNGTATAGGAPAKVLVSRTGDTSAALTVSYKATSADAVSGVDYRALTGKLVIPAGASSAKIKLSAIADNELEGDAKVKIKLKPAADGSYTLGAVSKVQLKLLDND